MGLRLHCEGATQAETLQELFVALKGLDAQNGNKDREFFQIEFPEADTPEERARIFEEIRERVIQIFAASAIALTDSVDKQSIMRDYVPVPGQATRYFDKDDLSVLADDVRRLLDPNDAHFQAALADREVGALQLLGRTLNFAIDHGDPRAAFKLFQRLTRGVRLHVSAAGISVPEDVVPSVDRELTELPWEKDDEEGPAKGGAYRKDILRQHLQEMIHLDYRLKNPKLVEALQGRFPAQQKLLTQLVDSYNASTLDLGVPDLDREQWFFILFSNLEKAKKMSRGLFDALKKLSRDIRTATQAPQISTAINTFVQETLPPILAASTSSPSPQPSAESPAPPSEPSGPEAPQKSS